MQSIREFFSYWQINCLFRKPETSDSSFSHVSFSASLVHVLPMLTLLFLIETSRCSFPCDLASLLLTTLPFASCFPEIEAFFTIPCQLRSTGFVIYFLLQYLSMLMSIVHVVFFFFFWIRHLSWKRFNSDTVIWYQGGLHHEEEVICCD